MILEEGIPLSRFTTLGTGGAAQAFAQPESESELQQALRWATERGGSRDPASRKR